MQKEWRQRISCLFDDSCIIDYDYKKESTQKQLGRHGIRNSWRVWKNFAKLEEYKFTLQWVRLNPHLLNMRNDLWKKTLPLHVRSCIQSESVSIRHNRELQKNCSIDKIPENIMKLRLSVHSVHQTTTRSANTQV